MLLAVAGMVGSGKTTLTTALSTRFGLQRALESVDEDNPWLEDTLERFVAVAESVYRAVAFDLAEVGADLVSGINSANPESDSFITRETVERGDGFLISPTLWRRLGPDVEARVLGTGMRWTASRRAE